MLACDRYWLTDKMATAQYAQYFEALDENQNTLDLFRVYHRWETNKSAESDLRHICVI